MGTENGDNNLLEYHLDVAKQLKEKAWQYAETNVVPLLSKAVLEKGQRDNDHRSLLMLANRTKDYKYETTDEFRTWSSLFGDTTAEAQAQVYAINNAGYDFYENISMMLEACDYFKEDIWKFILLGTLYVEGRFDPSIRR